MVEYIHPLVVYGLVVQAFAAGLRCMARGVASEVEETAGKIADGEPEIGEWSYVVFDLQRASANR